MGCAQSRLRTKISVRDVSATVKTGDLFLFSSKHAASHVTKCFTGSGWDHLGMVVKLSDSQVFILEYAGGVFLYPLFTRLYSYFAIQGREICLRPLSLPHERPGAPRPPVRPATRSANGSTRMATATVAGTATYVSAVPEYVSPPSEGRRRRTAATPGMHVAKSSV